MVPAPIRSTRRLRLATRGSPLARWQAGRVGALVQARSGRRCELVVVKTTGDRLAEVRIDQLAGQGAFVAEVQTAVIEGRADVAVHSAKDLPALTPAGLVIAAVPERGDPRDALVGARLADLPPGARVATGSVRRRAQLAWLRPDLGFVELRGNMARRLERAAHEGAGVVAVAALVRLGLDGQIAEVLEPGAVLPQAGQGALAVECRGDDAEARAVLAGIDDPVAHRALLAERAFLAALGSGCTLPVAALATPSGFAVTPDRLRPEADGVRVEGMLASRDGRVVLRRTAEGDDPESVGRRLATDLLERGGRFLDDWEPVEPQR